jgi:hypothetical protein
VHSNHANIQSPLKHETLPQKTFPDVATHHEQHISQLTRRHPGQRQQYGHRHHHRHHFDSYMTTYCMADTGCRQRHLQATDASEQTYLCCVR